MFELLVRMDIKQEQHRLLSEQFTKQEGLYDLTIKNLTKVRTDNTKIEQRLDKDRKEINRMKSDAEKNQDNARVKKDTAKKQLEDLQ